MSALSTLQNILKDNQFTPENVPELEGKLFFEGDRLRPYLVRFSVLLFLSTIIATFGILEDSTATVVGAMIVAPLMTPIIATTAALVMGRIKDIKESGLIVIYGVIMVIVVSFIIGFFTIVVISPVTNSQISSRISPSLDDLMIALAAGAAGAFAYSRNDVADSLPGVAIAIALVPPLSVVGIMLSQGNWSAAWGAGLLFITNLLSILLAGGFVFALLNLSKASVTNTKDVAKEKQRKAYKYIGFALLLVAIPLSITTFQVARDSVLQTRINDVAESWLSSSETDLNLHDVTVFGNTVNIALNGSSDPESLDELGAAIRGISPRLDDVGLRISVSKDVPVPTSGSEDD